MKSIILVLAIVAVSLATGLPTRGLHEDLQKFLDLVPKEKVISIALDYLTHDEEVQQSFEFIQSEEFKKLILDVESIPEYHKFLKYLQENGLNVYEVISKIHEFLELPEFVPRSLTLRKGKGIRGLLDDIKSVLPLDKIKALYYETLQTSPAFANLINVLKGDEFKNLVEELRANPVFKEIVERAKKHGVDIGLIVDILNKIFGWGIQEKFVAFRNLEDDLKDFLRLVPVNEILTIVLDYLANDEQVQEVFEYIQSEDFVKLVKDVESIEEYNKFLDYLSANGLDVYPLVNKINEFLGIEPLTPPGYKNLLKRGVGVRGLLDDILSVLPVDKIKALFYDKLQTSEDFANLVNVLKGEEFKKIVEELRANPVFKEIVERAKRHGVDVRKIIEILNKIFGWGINA